TYIFPLMAQGLAYAAAGANAQARGYADPDPTDDVDGHDAVAKIRILAAIAFGQSVALDQVFRRGIADVGPATAQRAVRDQRRIKLQATVRPRREGRRAGRSSSIEV